MNMLIRYFILSLLLKHENKIPTPFTSPITHQYRILPHDMGFRDHVPNYRYLSFIELNIQQWFLLQNTMEGAKWLISAQQMTYLKQGRLLDKVTVNSQVLGWDSKYFYFRHEFLVKHSLIAVAMTKIMLMADNTPLPTSTFADKPELSHPAIITWQQNLGEIKQLPPIK